MVEILESFILSKYGKEDGGEDRLILGPGFYGVADGATDKSGKNWGTPENPRKGGDILAGIVKEFFENQAYSRYSPKQIVDELNKRVHLAAIKAGIDLSIVKNRANVGFTVFSKHHNAILHIHDCNFVFISKNREFTPFYHEKYVDVILSEKRAKEVQRLQKKGIDPFKDGQDLGSEFILPYLKRQMELQNDGFDDEKPWAFGIPRKRLAYRTINGFPTEISTAMIPEGTQEIIIASDGFRILKSTLEETLVLHKKMLAEDPHCIGVLQSTKGLNPGQTSYDDQAYLRIRIK